MFLTFKNQETWKPRNLIRLAPLLSFCLLFFVVACNNTIDLTQEDSIVITSSYKDSTGAPPDTNLLINIESLYYGSPGTITTSLYAPSISNLSIEFEDGSDTIISLSAPLLAFSDTNELFEAIHILDYRPLDTLESFANSRNYTSLLSSYITPGANIYSAYFENNNISDFSVAALENIDAAVKIGDSIFVSIYNKNLSIIISISNNTYSIHKWPRSSNCINQGLLVIVEGYFNSDWSLGFQGIAKFKITSTKVNKANAYRSQLKCQMGVSTLISGEYTLLKSSQLNMRKDQWHIVKWKRDKKNATYNVVDNDIWVSTMGKKMYVLEYYFARRYAFLPKSYCVPEFQRIHNWTVDYNKDLHNETW